MNYKLWVLLLLNIAIGLIGQALMKYALILRSNEKINPITSLIELFLDWRIILAVACCIINLILYLFLLSELDLGFVFPLIVSLLIVGVYTLSVILFNEPLTVRNVIAILLIGLGIAIMKN